MERISSFSRLQRRGAQEFGRSRCFVLLRIQLSANHQAAAGAPSSGVAPEATGGLPSVGADGTGIFDANNDNTATGTLTAATALATAPAQEAANPEAEAVKQHQPGPS